MEARGPHRLDQPAHERPALTQALFLLRADLADVLWLVPGPEVLGSTDQRSRQTAALILAEAWAAGAQVVWGKDASGLEPDPVAQQVAEQCLLLADRFDPRQDQHDETGPADMGNYLDEKETERLAYKLRTDLYLSNEEISDLLNTSGFYSPRRRPLTPQAVSRLAARDSAEPSTPARYESELHLVVTAGPADVALVEQARGDAARGGVPLTDVLPLRSLTPREDHTSRLVTLLAMARLGWVEAVYATDWSDLGSTPAEQEALAAHLEALETPLLVAGTRVDDLSADPGRLHIRGLARQSVRLRNLLRQHDRTLVPDTNLSLQVARRLAQVLLAEGLSLAEVARRLNDGGYPTRRHGPGRHGSGLAWSKSAVKELIDNG